MQAHQARMREKLAKQQAINAIIANQAATAAQEYNEDFYGGADSIVPIPPPAPLVQEDDLYNAPTQPQFVRTASARVSANPAPLPPRGAGPPTGNPVPLPPRGATGQPASTPSNRLPVCT